MKYDSKILKEIRKSRKIKQEVFASLLGLKDRSSVSKKEGGAPVTIKELQALADGIGVDLSELFIFEGTEKIFHKEAEFRLIPKFTTPVSGGPGNIVCSNDTDREYSFRRDWLARRCPSNNCALFDVTGDSMSPVIADGDVVLVDMSKNTRDDIVDGKIYAFTEGNRIVIKKLEWRGSGLWAVPLNAQEYQIDETNHFGLIGRVIWVGHELK